MTDLSFESGLGLERGDDLHADEGRLSAEARAYSGGDQDSVLVQGIETAQAVAEEGRRWAELKRERARELIEENPLTSAGLLFAGGVLVGMLLNRR